MLFILFGTTAEMGNKSRLYFKKNGFEIIRKLNYVPEDYLIQDRFKKRHPVSREEVEKCDFIYENKGMLTGFSKEQIIDAVSGKKKCLLSVSSNTIEFVRQIKAAYGDYVTVIGTYTDDDCLRDMFASLPDITEDEIEFRFKVGQDVKHVLVEERKLFDELVIYGGENSVFNYQALFLQYGNIIEKAQRNERELNNKTYVEMPYSGNEKYIFVSYSHEDYNDVMPVLSRLQRAGCRIWYDEGIRGGENWRKILASKIQADSCDEFLLFSSLNSVRSRHVNAEINAALNCDKKITTIRMDEAVFNLEIEMYLQTYQTLFYSDINFSAKIKQAISKSVIVHHM